LDITTLASPEHHHCLATATFVNTCLNSSL